MNRISHFRVEQPTSEFRVSMESETEEEFSVQTTNTEPRNECFTCNTVTTMEGLSYGGCSRECRGRFCLSCLLRWHEEDSMCPICQVEFHLIVFRCLVDVNQIFVETMMRKLREAGEVQNREQCNKVDLVFELNIHNKMMTDELVQVLTEARIPMIEYLVNLPKFRQVLFKNPLSHGASVIRIFIYAEDAEDAEDAEESEFPACLNWCPNLLFQFRSETAILGHESFTFEL